jgi:hypothetical protein
MAGPQFFTPPKVAPSKSKRRFSLAEANKTLPLVSRIVADIVAAHQFASSLQEKLETPQSARSHTDVEGELERKLDRLQSLVEELSDLGVELKDYQTGLVDFIGRHKGHDVYLCWKLGETKIDYWHELDAGFAGRQPIASLVE